jgi:hypothetical protein
MIAPHLQINFLMFVNSLSKYNIYKDKIRTSRRSVSHWCLLSQISRKINSKLVMAAAKSENRVESFSHILNVDEPNSPMYIFNRYLETLLLKKKLGRVNDDQTIEERIVPTFPPGLLEEVETELADISDGQEIHILSPEERAIVTMNDRICDMLNRFILLVRSMSINAPFILEDYEIWNGVTPGNKIEWRRFLDYAETEDPVFIGFFFMTSLNELLPSHEVIDSSSICLSTLQILNLVTKLALPPTKLSLSPEIFWQFITTENLLLRGLEQIFVGLPLDDAKQLTKDVLMPSYQSRISNQPWLDIAPPYLVTIHEGAPSIARRGRYNDYFAVFFSREGTEPFPLPLNPLLGAIPPV